MNLIVVRENKNSANNGDDGLLRFVVSSPILADVVLDGLSKSPCLNDDTDVVVAIPKKWNIENCAKILEMMPYTKNIPVCSELLSKTSQNSWFIISNGRFATEIDCELLHRALTSIRADVIMVNVKPELLGKRERVRLTSQGRMAGFIRPHSDSAEPAPVPADWPHHLFINIDAFQKGFSGSDLPHSFSTFLKRCCSNALILRAISIGGSLLDLEKDQDLITFLATRKNSSALNHRNVNHKSSKDILDKDDIKISDSARLFGKVLLGRNVKIGQDVIVVGPTFISNNVKIGKAAVINSSVIGPGVCVSQNQLIQNRIIIGPQCNWKRLNHRFKSNNSKQICYPKLDLNHQQRANENFRKWPRFSYVGCFKRIADIVAAIIVLILFAPVLLIVALIVKLTSRGPVFFKDARQGLHSKGFNCLKFRTMLVGADKIQEKLRIISQVDGPQFKMTNDPRITAVGRFLRDTYIDEIPQFFNVLLGQMSIVGPRPSPESENTQCPSWRDARLSVRPGITGLWQICRTRQPMKDFQEWIYYDTKYVRNLSFKMDLWICWQTIKKLVMTFIRQF